MAIHREFAGKLQDALSKYGISAFVAHNDIEPTAEWQAEIESALSTCDVMLALLHTGFHASDWTDQEIGFAMGRAVPVFTIRLGEDPYGFIGRFQAFNGNGKSAIQLAEEIFNSLLSKRQFQLRLAPALVDLLERSGSFESAKVRTGYLEKLEVWAPEFSERILAAIEKNGQVRDSWGVPDRLKALVAKWE